MGLWQSVRRSLELLHARDRRVLVLVVALQAGIAVLDLAGVLLLGVVAALAASSATGQPIAFASQLTSLAFIPQNPTTEQVALLAAAAAVVLIVKSVIGLLLTRRTFHFLAYRQAVISSRLAERLLSRPLLQVQARSSQESTYALTMGVNAVTMGIIGQGVIIVSELLVMAALVGGLLFVDPIVTLFTTVFFGMVALALHRLLGGWAQRLGEAQSALEVDSTASVQHAIRAYREVTILGRRHHFIERFRGLRWQAARTSGDLYVLYQVSKYVYEIALVVGGGLLVLAAVTTRDLVAAMAVVTVFLAASSRIFPSLLRLQAALANMATSRGQAAPTFALIDDLDAFESQFDDALAEPAPATEQDRASRSGYPGFTSEVLVDHVTMTYPGMVQPALADVTIQIEAGHSTAIVGSTGSGKSTLVDVILGVIQPNTGDVRIAGCSPKEAVLRWPGAVTYVPQDVAVLTGTVRENVALGLPATLIDDDLVWEALERAHLSSFLRDNRDGLDTVVGENGVKLSGGQRQRLGIARALYTRPRFIVLDEATSALDAETERAITSTLDALAGSVTLVVVAHRLATIRNCDTVVYLSKGSVAARGTFDEVRAQVPDFDRQASLLGL